MSEAIGAETVVRRSEQVLWSSAGEDVVLLHMDRGAYHGLNVMGRRIWELLESPQLVSALCAQLMEAYEVEPEICEQETLRFLEDIRRKGLIEAA